MRKCQTTTRVRRSGPVYFKPIPDDSKLSPLQLRVDLAWAKGLLWLASSSRFATPKPEVHRFMFDRYWRLADHHERHGLWDEQPGFALWLNTTIGPAASTIRRPPSLWRWLSLVGRALRGPSRLSLMNRVTTRPRWIARRTLECASTSAGSSRAALRARSRAWHHLWRRAAPGRAD
jgi:hypothetical protein